MRPDPALAQPHAAGASLTVTQIIEHERLGAIEYVWPRFWPAFLTASRQARDGLGELHTRIENMSPGRDGTRSLSYEDIEPGLAAHVEMVICAVLTMRYFVLEVERIAELTAPTNRTDGLDRFRSVCTGAELSDPAERERWPMIGELIEIRHLIEHPAQDTIYSMDRWDRVPFAWSLTRRALDCFDAFDSIFGDVAVAWETRKIDYAGPVTLQLDARGLRARRPAKNPPKRSSIADAEPTPDP
jgi:hypothetical protein